MPLYSPFIDYEKERRRWRIACIKVYCKTTGAGYCKQICRAGTSSWLEVDIQVDVNFKDVDKRS